MKWNLLKRKERYVGIEFKDALVKLVEIEKTANGITIQNFHIEKVPDGLLSAGKIQDQDKFLTFLYDLKNKACIQSKNLHLSIDCQNVLLRPIKIPNIPKKDLEKALDLEIENNIQLPFDDYVADFVILTDEKELKAAKELNIMLVIAPKSHVMTYIHPLKELGFLPLSVDLAPLAVQRVMELESNGDLGETFMIVNVGEKSTEVSIVHNRVLRIVRTFSLDLQTYIEEPQIQDADALSFMQFQEERSGIRSFATDIGNEVERILNFYLYTLNNRDQTISELVLIGDLADMTPVAEYLSLRLNVETRLDLLKAENIVPALADTVKEVASSLIVPFGLAIKDVHTS